MARTSRIADLKIQWQIAYTKEDWIRTANIERILKHDFATGAKVLRDLEKWRAEHERKELERKNRKATIHSHDREAGGIRCRKCGDTRLELLWAVSEIAALLKLTTVPDAETPKQGQKLAYFTKECGARQIIEAKCAGCGAELNDTDLGKLSKLLDRRA